jgi:hypothetical protein
MHVELDSAGMGRMDEAEHKAASMDRLEAPELQNGGFDESSAPDGYVEATSVPHWNVFGADATPKVFIVSSGASAFGGVKSVDGTNMVGLRTRGNGIYQEVGGHIKENWYTLLWHASCHSPAGTPTVGDVRLKVSVGASVKFEEDVDCGVMKWYQASYQSFGDYGTENIRFEIPSGESSQDVIALIDKIAVHPEVKWDYTSHGPVTFGAGGGPVISGGQVMIQKVECAAAASKETCRRGKFLTCGSYSEDGITPIIESDAATECSVFTAQKSSAKSVKWKFKCNCLNQASSGGDNSGSNTVDDRWFLHSGYGPSTCQARNADPGFDKNFDVRDNMIGSLQMTTTGIDCGSLFAVMQYT